MTPGIGFALGSMLLFGAGDLIYKHGAADGAPAHHFLMVQSWVFAPLGLLYATSTGSLHFVAASLWGAVAGAFVFVGFYNFASSLRVGSVSTNAPIFRLSFVLTAVLAVAVLGEPVTVFKVAGIALALIAMWLLLRTPTDDTEAADPRELRSSLIRVLVATVAVGVGFFVPTLGLRAGATPGSLVITQAAAVVACATAFVATVERRIRPSPAAVRHAPRAAVALVLAFSLMLEAIARADASVVVPIAQMGFVITAMIGFLFLREPFTARKAAGIAAALAALGGLAYG